MVKKNKIIIEEEDVFGVGTRYKVTFSTPDITDVSYYPIRRQQRTKAKIKLLKDLRKIL